MKLLTIEKEWKSQNSGFDAAIIRQLKLNQILPIMFLNITKLWQAKFGFEYIFDNT